MTSHIKIVPFQNSQWISARSITNILSTYKDPALQFVSWITVRLKPFQDGTDYFVTMTQDGSLIGKEGKVPSLKEILLTPATAIAIAKREKNDHLAEEINLLFPQPVEQNRTDQQPVNHAQVKPQPDVLMQVLPIVEGDPMQSITIIHAAQIGLAVTGRSVFNMIAKDSSVSARDIFSDWVKERIAKYRYVANVDYVVLPKSYMAPGKSAKSIDYLFSLSMAKQIAMDQRKGRGMNLLYALKAYERTGQDAAPKVVEPAAPELPLDTVNTTTLPKQEKPTTFVEAVAPMPALVSKTRSQQLIEELERTLREEAETTPAPNDLVMIANRITVTEQRLDNIDQWMKTVIGFFQQGATLLAGELPVGIPETNIAEQQPADPFHAVDFSAEPVDIDAELLHTPRRKLIQLVNDYAEAKHHPFKDVWRFLYGQLNTVHHFNVSRKHIKENYLDYAERSGHLDNLLSIAQSSLRPVVNGAQA